MKCIYLVCSLIFMLSACGKSNLAAGTGSTPSPDPHGNTVKIDKLRGEQIVGGCTLQMSATATASGTTSCVDFVQTPRSDMTKDQVAAFCANTRGQQFVDACPTINVNALCQLNYRGTTGYVMVYNSSNPGVLKNFADNCRKRGGQINP